MPLILLLAAACALGVTGCGPTEAAPSPTPTTTATEQGPLFSTDEEALKAAEEVYRKYLEVVDSGVELWHLREVATSETIEREQAMRDELHALGRHLEGTTVLRSIELQRFDGHELTSYNCLDLSGIRVRDELGTDVTPETRTDYVTLEVTFVTEGDRLLIAESTLWSSSC